MVIYNITNSILDVSASTSTFMIIYSIYLSYTTVQVQYLGYHSSPRQSRGRGDNKDIVQVYYGI